MRTSLFWVARIPMYPIHFAFRVLARLVLIAAAAAPLVGLVLLGWWFRQDLLDLTHYLAKKSFLPAAVAFLIVVGVFAVVLKAMGQLILNALKLLGEIVKDALRGNWHPGWEVISSFVGTWRDYIVKVPSTFLQTFKSTCVIALAVLGVAVLAWSAYPLTKPKMVDRYIVVVDPSDDRPEEIVKDEIKVHLSTRTIFSLTYLKDAQPQEGEGVCLEEGHKEWLRVFRDAIVECVQLERSRQTAEQGATSEYVPTFDVVGFASVAPMQGSDHDEATLNCDVANRRADAVGGFLADEEEYKSKWDCGEIGRDFKSSQELCTGRAEVYKRSLAGIHYRVRVHKWSNPERMQGGKPADDGALPDQRRYGVELLNRTVHITVPENFCQEPEVPQKAASQ